MTTALQLAMLAGGLVALGLTLAVLALAPSQPDLGDVVRRYAATAATRRDAATPDASSSTEKLGLWGIAHVPSTWWGHTPTRDLALLQTPLHRHYGKEAARRPHRPPPRPAGRLLPDRHRDPAADHRPAHRLTRPRPAAVRRTRYRCQGRGEAGS